MRERREELCLDGGDFGGIDRDEAAELSSVLEANHAGDFGEEGVVFAAADVEACLERCAALADDDAAAEDCLAAEYLHPESLGV